MGLLQAVGQSIGGLLGVGTQPTAQAAQPGGISVWDATGNQVLAPAQFNSATPTFAPSSSAAPSIPTPSTPNPFLGAIDHLLFNGAFGTAQNEALQRRMAMYQAQQLQSYGASLPDDQRQAFFADPQGYLKTQEEIAKARGSGVKISDNSVQYGGPTGPLVQAGSQGIDTSTNKPFSWAPNVTNIGTGAQSGGLFQAGPAIGGGQPTAANGILTAKPTSDNPTGVLGTYSTSTSQALPGQTITTSPNVTWAPNSPSAPLVAPAPADTNPAPMPGGQQTNANVFLPRIRANPGEFFSTILGAPVTVTSGARTPARNAAVGGSPTSEHLTDSAWDLKPPPGVSNTAFMTQLVQAGVPFDQMIDEGTHVHFGVGPKMRGAVMQARKSGGYRTLGVVPQDGAQDASASGQPASASVSHPNIQGSVTSTGGGAGGSRYSIVDGSQVPGGKAGERWTVDSLGVEKPTPVPGGFTMDTVQHNRESFYKSEQYKNATENLAPVKGLFDTINSVAPGGVMSVAALDTLNKSLNPGGVVRPQTVNLFLEHMGLPEELKSHILNTVGNGFLSPQVIQQIGRASWVYSRAHIQQAQDLAQKDEALAVAHGYNPTDVGETAPTAPPVPQWAQDQIPPAPQRKVGSVYWGPRGPGKWTGKGWELQ